MNTPAAASRRNDKVTSAAGLALCVVLLIASFLLSPAASAIKPADPDSPEATVKAFYDICVEEKVTGLPTEAQFDELRPLISEALYGLLADARMEQAEFSRENPYEKPPWIEGDLFSSLFEGPTRFTIGETVIDGKRATVTIDFVDDSPSDATPFRWHDDVVLVQNSEGDWLVDDIVYRGDWDFASKGRLSDTLSPHTMEDDE
ncbi:MAG: hypothetical protein HYU52_06390 [Acidobacteria bacterium]|nr:hypothetical protein [Acidobacteriota bacterium]